MIYTLLPAMTLAHNIFPDLTVSRYISLYLPVTIRRYLQLSAARHILPSFTV